MDTYRQIKTKIDTYRKTKKYQQKWIPSDKDRNKYVNKYTEINNDNVDKKSDQWISQCGCIWIKNGQKWINIDKDRHTLIFINNQIQGNTQMQKFREIQGINEQIHKCEYINRQIHKYEINKLIHEHKQTIS